jgi:hypothetical protein
LWVIGFQRKEGRKELEGRKEGIEGYGLWVKIPRIPTWSLQNSMGF